MGSCGSRVTKVEDPEDVRMQLIAIIKQLPTPVFVTGPCTHEMGCAVHRAWDIGYTRYAPVFVSRSKTIPLPLSKIAAVPTPTPMPLTVAPTAASIVASTVAASTSTSPVASTSIAAAPDKMGSLHLGALVDCCGFQRLRYRQNELRFNGDDDGKYFTDDNEATTAESDDDNAFMCYMANHPYLLAVMLRRNYKADLLAIVSSESTGAQTWIGRFTPWACGFLSFRARPKGVAYAIEIIGVPGIGGSACPYAAILQMRDRVLNTLLHELAHMECDGHPQEFCDLFDDLKRDYTSFDPRVTFCAYEPPPSSPSSPSSRSYC